MQVSYTAVHWNHLGWEWGFTIEPGPGFPPPESDLIDLSTAAVDLSAISMELKIYLRCSKGLHCEDKTEDVFPFLQYIF